MSWYWPFKKRKPQHRYGGLVEATVTPTPVEQSTGFVKGDRVRTRHGERVWTVQAVDPDANWVLVGLLDSMGRPQARYLSPLSLVRTED